MRPVIMDKKFLFNIGLIFFCLLTIYTESLEAVFFGYPKKSLTDFLDSLKERKEDSKRASHSDRIHHLHLHYYPVPVSFVLERKPLDTLHRAEFRSLAWTKPKIVKQTPRDQDYSKIEGLTVDDQIDLSAVREKFSDLGINRFNKGSNVRSKANDHHRYDFNKIFFNLPIKQEIVIHQPIKNDDIDNNNNNNNKSNPLTNFFQYLNRIKNYIFRRNNRDIDYEDYYKSSENNKFSVVKKLFKFSTSFDNNVVKSNIETIYGV